MPAPAAGAAAAAPRRVPPGVWAALVVGLASYGSSAVLIRAAGPVEPLAIAAWRTALVALALAPVALVRAGAEMRRLPQRSWALTLASGVLLGLHFSAWIASVQLTTVASAAVLVTTTPLWVGMAGLAGVGERPTPWTLAAIGVGVIGAALIGLGGAGEGPVPPDAPLGNALALGASVLVAAYTVVGAGVRRGASFLAYFAPVNAVAAATAGAVCVLGGASLVLPAEALGWVAAMAAGPGLVGHGSFALALGYVPAARLSLLTLSEPVLATGLAFALFHETPGVAAAVGMALVLGSIALVTLQPTGPRSEKRRRPRAK